MTSRLFPLLFLAAVLLRTALLVKLGDPFPPGLRSDANVYLELGLNLWRDGVYQTNVSITYPPIYPLVVAPTFGLEGNADRFAAVYVLHGLLLGVGALAMFPMLRGALGARRSWLLLAAAQFLFGSIFHGYNPQTETLFAVELLATAALCHLAWRAPRRIGPWIALGAVCGIAVSTRRAAAVVPIAIGMLWVHDMVQAFRAREPLPWTRPGFLVAGLIVGLMPEAISTLAHGNVISPYTGTDGRSPTLEHLGAAPAALTSLGGLLLATQTTARHASYVIFTTAGAPILLVLWLWKSRRSTENEALRRTLGFVVYVTLGVVALTVLHILRYRLGRAGMRGWDLYPRYVDPLETLLVVSGAVAAWRLVVEGAVADALSAAGGGWQRLQSILPWTLLTAFAVAFGTVVVRSRGGRIRSLKHWQRTDLAEWGLALFPVAGAMVVIGLTLWWLLTANQTRARRLWWVPVAFAIVISWGISTHSWVPRVTRTAAVDRRPPVLKMADLHSSPTTPLAVLVHKPGAYGRGYYAPGFRSDHPVRWLKPNEVNEWLRENRGGLVLTKATDPRPSLPFITKGQKWVLSSAEGRGAPGGLTPE